MGRRINPLSNPQESQAKKKAIENILENARHVHGLDVATWLPRRRYLQKTLWSLSLAELNAWTFADTMAVMAKLDGKDPKSKQIAYLEEIVAAQGISLKIISRDSDFEEKAKQAIAHGRHIGLGL